MIPLLRHPRTEEETKKVLAIAMEDVKSGGISHKDAVDQ
jgi:hypothetical protein